MFPLRWNFPFRKKDGSMVNLEDAMSGGGGGGYTLPTASAEIKGGVKIGSGLTMTGEVLSVTGGGGGGNLYLHNFTFEFNSTNKLTCPLILTTSSPITSKDDLWDILNNNGSPVMLYGFNMKTNSEPPYAVGTELSGSSKGWRRYNIGGSTYAGTGFTLTDEVLPIS